LKYFPIYPNLLLQFNPQTFPDGQDIKRGLFCQAKRGNRMPGTGDVS